MLKYKININKHRNTLIPIHIADFTVEDIINDVEFDENMEVKNYVYSDRQLLMCRCNDELPFDTDSNIIVMSEQYMSNDDLSTSTAYNFDNIYKPTAVDKESRSFTLTIDKYYNLSVNTMNVFIDKDEDGNDVNWLYVYFNGSHLFNFQRGKTYNLYLTVNSDGWYNESIPYRFLLVRNIGDINEDEYTKYSGIGEVVSSSTIRIQLSSEIRKLFDENSGEPLNLKYKFYRDEFIFVPNGFSLYVEKSMAMLQIPFSQKFSTDLMQDDALRENFVNVERKKAINSITEMEKDVYHPVIWNSTNNELVSDVYKIRFNLHFRQHRGDNWLAEPDSYWNGVTLNENGNPGLNKDYFIYKNKENQSDLLTYLGFTDKDIRYQKNKLKKSFLRVMFYDSPNPTNQNMLAYYTIFMDSGSYFSKYARYIETDGYKKFIENPILQYKDNNTDKIISNEEYENLSDEEKINYNEYYGYIKKDLTGIKVDREPSRTSNLEEIDVNTDIDDIEEVRIGSQIVVNDKYMSDASSEGFYLYLWKDNMNGIVPTDIYMKVEFNHAGYGRTIPFMMPFFDKKKDGKAGIKTFEQIIEDWSVEDRKYGIKKYLKYSYIHFKYKYDKETNRHVYYLDDEFYGNDVHFKDNAITLNLYEAKIV